MHHSRKEDQTISVLAMGKFTDPIAFETHAPSRGIGDAEYISVYTFPGAPYALVSREKEGQKEGEEGGRERDKRTRSYTTGTRP